MLAFLCDVDVESVSCNDHYITTERKIKTAEVKLNEMLFYIIYYIDRVNARMKYV